jgi:serine/threonine protein kinase
MAKSANWTTVSESRFPWEREALEFVRAQLPADEAYRAWANFEFIADDGSINEVDLLIFTPCGFFLTEIKSRGGRLFGDAGTWSWESEGRIATHDNPLIAANLKAKKLRSLLQRQKAFKNKGQVPFIEVLAFCSASDLRNELQGNGRLRVCLRDRPKTPHKAAQPGIVEAVLHRNCPGLDPYPRGTHDRPMAKVVSQAMDQAGIRASQRTRKVGDYVLRQVIGEGPGYQDWFAAHNQVEESRRRVRLYLVRTEATPEDRATIQRAALREFQILETLEHPGILRAYNFTEHELGPALLFEHDPLSVRLDHFLAQHKDNLSVDSRLDLIRQIAEVVRYAHEKKVIHRGLCPQSILVTGLNTARPRIKVFNWQIGYRQGTGSTIISRSVAATSHVDRLVDDAATAYMAPEALTEANTGEHLDVFSLGAIAWHVFSGQIPAANAVELSEKLRDNRGLQISSVLNGASEWLQELVRYATNPVVPDRMESVDEFLSLLEEVENEFTTPDRDYTEDPSTAQIGDLLPDGYRVLKRLGQGACSIALLVERDGQEFVLKVANTTEYNPRLIDEADLLRRQELRHPGIVDLIAPVQMGQHQGFLMRPVFADKETRLIETLAQRLRKEGRLHIEMLQRFGEDLLTVVNHLEEQGIPHRDIKPDNIAVGKVGRGDKLHLVLFDFSLSRTPPDNIRAGTTGYLDPLLPLRRPPRWDLHAERYAAAITLYELATGTLPKWGDGSSDPSHLSHTTEISIDPELFDAALREPLKGFFRQAFRRDIAQRFDNAEEMLRQWRQCFAGLDQSAAFSDHTDTAELARHLAQATFETQIAELGLGTRATNALDRANILTVDDLLGLHTRVLLRLRGIGTKTRREIAAAIKVLRERLGRPERHEPVAPAAEEMTGEVIDLSQLSLDLIADRLLKTGAREGDTLQQTLRLLLGINDPGAADGLREAPPQTYSGRTRSSPAELAMWPSQSAIAELASVTRARVGQIISKLQERWAKDQPLTRIRTDLAEVIASQGGVMSLRELTEAILVARGSSQEEPLRTRLAVAVVRAATEVERTLEKPRFHVRRDGQQIAVCNSADSAAFARRLGAEADRLADEDPLLASTRVIERLREVPAPVEIALSDARLLRMAAEFSEHAAVSSRQELYPRGMPAARALKLSQGALIGQRALTVDQIHERVSGRYPQATPLPDRPELDQLLQQAGIELRWDAKAKDGAGCYVSPMKELLSVTSGSESIFRQPTQGEQTVVGAVTPEEADARQFEERLQRSLKEGSFLALLVNPKHYDRACSELCRRFPLQLMDFEGLFLDALEQTASKARVKWDLVLQTDTHPDRGDWDKLMMLVGRAMPAVEQQLLAADRTMLMVYPGLLARYNQMDLLSRLSQKVGRDGGIPGLWLLLPGDGQALIDGKPVPLIGPGQRTRIPESWIANVHRAVGGQRAAGSGQLKNGWGERDGDVMGGAEL